MTELTEREKKIILIKYIIHGVSPYADAPLDKRVQMLATAATFYGIPYDDKEFQELGRAILSLQQEINDSIANTLQENKDLYEAAMRQWQKGNDGITDTDVDFTAALNRFMGLKK